MYKVKKKQIRKEFPNLELFSPISVKKSPSPRYLPELKEEQLAPIAPLKIKVDHSIQGTLVQPFK